MSVSTLGVIGAGVMGSGIAQVAATNGINVLLLDVNEKAVKQSIDAVESRLSRVVTKGKMTAAEKDAAVRRIKGATAYESLKPADVIIEAATENYDLKTKIFKQVDSQVVRSDGAESILASNTSSISITKLASSISHPQRFVGLHFFNLKFLTASIATTILSGVVLNVLGTETEVMASSSQVAAKGDRLDIRPNEALCGDWPFYHHACLHDLKNSGGRARKGRVISQANRRHPTFLTFLSR